MDDQAAHFRAFAGDDPEAAHYFPEDGRFLSAKDPRVRHCEVAVAEHDR